MRRTILAIGFLALLAAAPASAQSDGLQRFERDAKPQLLKGGSGLTYREATALGPSGFVLTGVVLSETAGKQPSGKPSRMTIERLTVEDIDFERIAAGLTPEFLRLRADGIRADADADGSELVEGMKRYDIPNVPLDLVLDYRLDSARKVFALNRLELTMPGLARIEFSLTLDGVASLETPEDEKARERAAAQVALRTASLVYDDGSLLRRLLTAAAREMGTVPASLVADATGFLGTLGVGQPAEALAVLDALVSFIEDWRQPAGPIRISVNPPATVGMSDYEKLTASNAIKTVFGLSVGYAGTRAGAAARAAESQTVATAPPAQAPVRKPLAAPPTTSTAARATVACTTGSRLFALDGGVWWPATARAPVPDRQCVVRFDGESEDAVIPLDTDTTLAWSFEGPGRPATACRKDDFVVVPDDGAWYVGRVKNDAPPDRPCPVKYVGDYDDEEVPLNLVRVMDR